MSSFHCLLKKEMFCNSLFLIITHSHFDIYLFSSNYYWAQDNFPNSKSFILLPLMEYDLSFIRIP